MLYSWYNFYLYFKGQGTEDVMLVHKDTEDFYCLTAFIKKKRKEIAWIFWATVAVKTDF